MEEEPQEPWSEPLTAEAFWERKRPGPTPWVNGQHKLYSENAKSGESEKQIWEELGGEVWGEYNKNILYAHMKSSKNKNILKIWNPSKYNSAYMTIWECRLTVATQKGSCLEWRRKHKKQERGTQIVSHNSGVMAKFILIMLMMSQVHYEYPCLQKCIFKTYNLKFFNLNHTWVTPMYISSIYLVNYIKKNLALATQNISSNPGPPALISSQPIILASPTWWPSL